MFRKHSSIMGNKGRIPLTPYLLLLPAVILLIMFSFYPFAKTIISSFSITTEFGDFIRFHGFGNWIRVFQDEEFLPTIIRTLQYAAIGLVVSLTVALVFALMCVNVGKGSRIYQTFFALPMVIASAPIAAIFKFAVRENAGLLNQVLGTDIAWLKETQHALWIVALASAWGHIASNYLYLLVGFRNVPNELIEAAKIDGAGWWARTIRIMIPMASPQIFYVLFLNIIWSLKNITMIKLLTGGGPVSSTTTLMWSIYAKNAGGQFEYACCMALVLFIVIFLFTRIQFACEKKFVHYQ